MEYAVECTISLHFTGGIWIGMGIHEERWVGGKGVFQSKLSSSLWHLGILGNHFRGSRNCFHMIGHDEHGGCFCDGIWWHNRAFRYLRIITAVFLES